MEVEGKIVTPTIMGQIIKPMKADVLPDNFETKNHIIETKLDGHRIIVEVTGDGDVHSWSSIGRTSNHKMDEGLIDNIRNSLLPGVYDGELHLPGPGTTSSDVALKTNRSKLVFTAFDMLFMYGIEKPNLMNNSLSFRKMMLSNSWYLGKKCKLADYRITSGMEHVWDIASNLMEQGYEGVIVKNLDSIYQPGKRSKDWLKIKGCDIVVLKIVGYEPPATETEYGVMLLRGEVSGKEITTSVKVPNLVLREKFEKAPNDYIGRRVLIEYQNLTTHGLLRHPRFDRFQEERT